MKKMSIVLILAFGILTAEAINGSFDHSNAEGEFQTAEIFRQKAARSFYKNHADKKNSMNPFSLVT